MVILETFERLEVDWHLLLKNNWQLERRYVIE